MEHIAQQNLDIELSLYPVNYVDSIEVSLLVEPAMSNWGREDERNRKLPYLHIVRGKVKHRTEVLLGPVVPQLLCNYS